jgi:hypothetical protein
METFEFKIVDQFIRMKDDQYELITWILYPDKVKQSYITIVNPTKEQIEDLESREHKETRLGLAFFNKHEFFWDEFHKLKQALATSDVDAIQELLLINKSKMMLVKKHKLIPDLENHLTNIVKREALLKGEFIQKMNDHNIEIQSFLPLQI